MAHDDPGRQPFAGNCTANSTAVDSGFGEIGPVPAKKRLVVESVSAQLVTSTSGALYTMQLNGPFTLFMIPALITDGAFSLRRYYATHAIRFYVESGDSIQFQVATTGDAGQGSCYVSGYFLDT
ncbi:MAG: hypothetical protein WA690_16540 [Candidatus Acidiferrales bacterium]